VSSVEESLRLLTIGDHALEAILVPREGQPMPRLDARTEALVRLAALIAIDGPPPSFRAAVDAAQRAGAREEDVLAVLCTVADLVGIARVVSAAPRIALATGYDAEAALE
jgi:4-carboxymuconolactone decarboxylase